MNPAIISETSNTTAERLTGWTPLRLTWPVIKKPDCTMREGAKWTLHPNGTATFEATVTSTKDNKTWTIWHVDLLDRNGTILGSLATEHPIEGDSRKFVRPMPSSTESYEFRAWATFDKTLWPNITTLKMHSSC
jgi:hypothetical protein